MRGSTSPGAAALVAIGLSIVAAACGTSSDVGVGAPPAPSTVAGAAMTAAPTAPTTAPSAVPTDRSASILPSLAMTDVRSDATVDLASLVPAQRPLLLWFWAPH